MKNIAAFDFDGTLTTKDTLIPFFFYKDGFFKTCYHLCKVFPSAILYLIGKKTRAEVKEHLLSYTLKGMTIQDLHLVAKDYAEKRLPLYLNPERMKLYYKHKSQGHLCVLVSANLEPFLIIWAAGLGFDAVIATRLELNKDLYTGLLQGDNCWGKVKSERLLDWAGPRDGFVLWSYGDSEGDKELLAMADYPTKF